ncbi:hypothetical protein BP5796_09232 [Coleophoma crateriformis]|uniref:DH domain-containing protein n=1 Tax=Coleophoma crateriformis TaxID=565419 RepID=A0A3D8R3F2_9HELO|nr:hypothetical protein BP5796_09232 [Coleophoma crateriformis]
MESGINADQNFYRRPGPTTSASTSADHEHQPRHHHHHSPSSNYPPPPLPNFEGGSPQLPPKVSYLTTQNIQAVTSNGHAGRAAVEEPDEFYKEYRGVHSANNYAEITNGMATSVSDLRQGPSSLRSNSNGTTPKHPSLSAPRTGLKAPYRSVSTPMDGKSSLGAAKSTPALKGVPKSSQQPSVKDLLKRFDANNAGSAAPAVRKPPPRIPTKSSSDSPYTRSPSSNSNLPTAGASKAGHATRETGLVGRNPTFPRTTQRAKFAPEDQHSNNTLSSAARTARPRIAVPGHNGLASKSAVNLSPSATQNPSFPSQTRRPLFGEVLNGAVNLGYGISDNNLSRRTSESGLHPKGHFRSHSDVDLAVSPSSPTAWYLGVTPELDDVEPSKVPRAISGHNRAHSDSPDPKTNPIMGVNITAIPRPQSPPPTKTSGHSRIPKRLNTPSDSSSPPSTRANSPFAAKALSNGKLRKPDPRPWSPAGRATTPTARATTPVNRTTPRARGKDAGKHTATNGSLQAYISAPPPKTSPQLRSSRPRQPVSSASTASSRQKFRERSEVRERSGSPGHARTGMRVTRTTRDESPQAKNAFDVKPVDFAARRAEIKRAYTKSIHGTEREIIKAANMKRLAERHASTDRPGESEALPTAEQGQETPQVDEIPHQLQIDTAVSTPKGHSLPGFSTVMEDSPTLGVPGSFPGKAGTTVDDVPQSAISNATATTEIDNEPQTAPAQMSPTPAAHPLESSSLSQHAEAEQYDAAAPPVDLEVENDTESLAVPLILDNAPSEVLQVQERAADAETPPTPSFPGAFHEDAVDVPENTHVELVSTYNPLERDPSPPGAFQDSPASTDQPVFTTTLTSASPQRATPDLERADTLEQMNEVTIENELSKDEDLPPKDVEESPDLQSKYGPVSDQAPRLELPLLRTALSAPSETEYLHTPVTDMEYESSGGLSGRASSAGAYEMHSRNLLHSPGMYASNRQSAWTDFSMETGDECSEQDDRLSPFEEPEERPVPPPKEIPPEVPPKPESYTPQPSPRFLKDVPLPSNPHQLSSLTPGSGVGLGLSDPTPGYAQHVTVKPLWAEYTPPALPAQPESSPPPPPPSRSPPPASFNNNNSRRPASSVYRSSQQGSRRASDDAYSPRASLSTPRSSTHISLEDVSTVHQPYEGNSSVPTSSLTVFESEEDKIEAEKRKRFLHQRKCIIKELIDTEAVYLKDMNVVEEIYKGTAEACPKLDENDVKIIFRNTNEIVAFTTTFLDELKSAGSSVYSTRTLRSRQSRSTTAASSIAPSHEDRLSTAGTLTEETDEQKDRKTFIGMNFGKHLKKMQVVYADFLKNSEVASTRLGQLQTDPAVKVWLQECNLVAKDLTAAWSLDALLVKPVQRITRYRLLLNDLQKHTDEDHPDSQALTMSIAELDALLKSIDDLKRRIDMVGKIVGRKRKESDVRSGLAKAFGRKNEKTTSATKEQRPNDDESYLRLHEKYQDDFLRLQVVLRDVEFYTRQTTTYVADFLRYLSSIELVMRLSPSLHPELESKWARFNMGMRDMGTVALEDHVASVRLRVISPFEQVIALYGAPSVAMKKRAKRRVDYEKSLQLKNAGKKVDDKLQELVDQYEALNETLKLELPKLAMLTKKMGLICIGNFVDIQAEWFNIWQEKVKVVLEESQLPKSVADIVESFKREFPYVESKARELGIVNGAFLESSPKARSSQSTRDDESMKSRNRPSNLSNRSRGLSINSDKSPSLPTPDFAKRLSGQFTFSPIVANAPGLPSFAPRDQTYSNGHSRGNSGSPAAPDTSFRQNYGGSSRPETSRSFTSNDGISRPSHDYGEQHRRQSSSTNYSGHHIDGPLQTRPYSGLFHSALPMPDGPEDSQRSSRASSRDRNMSGGYNVLYLAASLFEFNISATKSEAGYPYLTYSAGEIFDVIGEKGELWLAKNQDDPSDQVGWIWSKHFARLAAD